MYTLCIMYTLPYATVQKSRTQQEEKRKMGASAGAEPCKLVLSEQNSHVACTRNVVFLLACICSAGLVRPMHAHAHAHACGHNANVHRAHLPAVVPSLRLDIRHDELHELGGRPSEQRGDQWAISPYPKATAEHLYIWHIGLGAIHWDRRRLRMPVCTARLQRCVPPSA